MNCLRCELARARIKASALVIVGWTLFRVADHLSSTYGERYYIEGGSLYRAAKQPPYKPYLIWEPS